MNKCNSKNCCRGNHITKDKMCFLCTEKVDGDNCTLCKKCVDESNTCGHCLAPMDPIKINKKDNETLQKLIDKYGYHGLKNIIINLKVKVAKLKEKVVEVNEPVVSKSNIVATLNIKRKPGWIYFIRNTSIYRTPMKRPDRPNQKGKLELVVKSKFERQEGFLYYLNRNGNIARTKTISTPVKV
jgi:ferredoxin